MKKTVVNDVEVTEDDDGNMHFAPVEKNSTSQQRNAVDSRSWLQKMIDWLKSDSAPYVKLNDRADPVLQRRQTPEDQDVGSDGAAAVEVGWRWKF